MLLMAWSKEAYFQLLETFSQREIGDNVMIADSR